MFDFDPRVEPVAREGWERSVEALPAPTAVVGKDGRLLLANASFRRLLLGKAARFEPLPGRPGEVQVGPRAFSLLVRRLPDRELWVELQEVAVQHSAAPLERPKIGARFLSIAAHDLRGAMANVRSFAGLLLSRGLVEGERGRKGAEAIVRNADRALALARDVFDSLRHELGEMPVNLEPTAFGPLLEAVVQKALQSALEPAPKLETDLPLGLPQVSLDAERTAHAFRELIDLSMANAGAAGKVEVLARVVPGHLLAAVADDGPPRSPEELAYALDRDSAAAHENRLGQAFRLCFAREELEAQGGRVSLASDEAGNEVQVLFPLALAG